VVFEKFSGSEELAGQRIHLPASAKFQGQLDSFLLGPFKWNLKHQILGGDIHVEPYSTIRIIMNGALTNGIDPQAPIWQTRFGKEILNLVRRPDWYTYIYFSRNRGSFVVSSLAWYYGLSNQLFTAFHVLPSSSSDGRLRMLRVGYILTCFVKHSRWRRAMEVTKVSVHFALKLHK